MTGNTRMSPMTAFFLGIFGVVAVGIASGAAVTLFALNIVDGKASTILRFAEGTIETTLKELPDLLESLPETVQDLLNDRRAPEYADQLDVTVSFLHDERHGGFRPVATIVNKGSEVVTLLAIRVAALNEQSAPLCEWTEIVATPIAIEDEWRGPLYPGNTRYVTFSTRYRGAAKELTDTITGAVEIADVRIWNQDQM